MANVQTEVFINNVRFPDGTKFNFGKDSDTESTTTYDRKLIDTNDDEITFSLDRIKTVDFPESVYINATENVDGGYPAVITQQNTRYTFTGVTRKNYKHEQEGKKRPGISMEFEATGVEIEDL